MAGGSSETRFRSEVKTFLFISRLFSPRSPADGYQRLPLDKFRQSNPRRPTDLEMFTGLSVTVAVAHAV